jgi:hypothetical protein
MSRDLINYRGGATERKWREWTELNIGIPLEWNPPTQGHRNQLTFALPFS